MMKPRLYATMLVMGLILTSSVVLSQDMRSAEVAASGDIYGKWQFFATDTWLIFEKDKITMEDNDCGITASSPAKITAESYAALSEVKKSGKDKAGNICSVGLNKDTAYYEVDGDTLYLFMSKDHKAGGKKGAIKLKRKSITAGAAKP